MLSFFVKFSFACLTRPICLCQPAAPDHSVDVKNASLAASLQPPLPLVSTRLSSFTPGTAAAAGPLLSGSSLSFNGSPQMVQTDQTMKPVCVTKMCLLKFKALLLPVEDWFNIYKLNAEHFLL